MDLKENLTKHILMFSLILVLAAVTVSAELLPYRPTCANTSLIVNKPWKVTDYWPDSTENGAYNICYINENTTFFRYDWGVNSLGQLQKTPEDIYAVNIQSISASFKARSGFTVTYDYYFPSDNGRCYSADKPIYYPDRDTGSFPSGWYTVYGNPGQQSGRDGYWYSLPVFLINNPDITDVPPNQEIMGVDYYMRDTLMLSCDTWYKFEKSNLEMDFDGSFFEPGVTKDFLASIGFQTYNMYIRNMSITNTQTKQVFKVY